jgi:hypothetical protein
VDCSCNLSDIHRSLVQIRLEGFFEIFLSQSGQAYYVTKLLYNINLWLFQDFTVN